VSIPSRCPDSGTCHHGCPVVAACFRVAWSGPLTGTYPGDNWPSGLMTAALQARGAYQLAKADADRLIRDLTAADHQEG
jgi:hypothetical protein